MRSLNDVKDSPPRGLALGFSSETRLEWTQVGFLEWRRCFLQNRIHGLSRDTGSRLVALKYLFSCGLHNRGNLVLSSTLVANMVDKESEGRMISFLVPSVH